MHEEATIVSETTPAIRKPGVTDLYRALKLASDISSKCALHSWNIDSFKSPGFEDYQLDNVLKELLLAESALEMTRQVFNVAKAEIGKAMQSKLFEQF